MGSSGKKKTTFAKLARESKLRERRMEKAARKDARKRGELPASRWEDVSEDIGSADDASGEEVAVGDAPSRDERPSS